MSQPTTADVEQIAADLREFAGVLRAMETLGRPHDEEFARFFTAMSTLADAMECQAVRMDFDDLGQPVEPGDQTITGFCALLFAAIWGSGGREVFSEVMEMVLAFSAEQESEQS